MGSGGLLAAQRHCRPLELFWIYPHGFPFAPTPADGVRGFGWQTLAAWILIWAAGLAIAAPSVLARSGRAVRAVVA